MKIRVNFDVEIPEKIDPEDIEEWLRFQLNESGVMDGKNPLVDRELEAVGFSVDWLPVRAVGAIAR